MNAATEKLSPEERAEALRERLGLPALDVAAALEALTHRSYANEHRATGAASPLHNERLEFLGDAVVDLAISHRLMARFPDASEGQLSKLRARVVSEDGLARVARKLRLGELLLLGKGEDRTGGRDKPSLLADALEAVLGAVYRTLGLEAVGAVVDVCFVDALAALEQEGGHPGDDFKSLLQEQVQLSHGQPPRYRLVGETGPEHAKLFEVEVWIGETVHGRATGRNKKEAEQAAAQKTLALLRPVGENGAGQAEDT